MLINVKITFISRVNFMLSWVEHEKSFITSGLDTDLHPCNESILKIKLHNTGLSPNRKVHTVKLNNKGLIVHLQC